jgi:hypothetical protein
MSTVKDIERAIVGLSPQELDELYAWMDEHASQQIDARLKSDLEAGRMDASIRRALAEHKAGDAREL